MGKFLRPVLWAGVFLSVCSARAWAGSDMSSSDTECNPCDFLVAVYEEFLQEEAELDWLVDILNQNYCSPDHPPNDDDDDDPDPSCVDPGSCCNYHGCCLGNPDCDYDEDGTSNGYDSYPDDPCNGPCGCGGNPCCGSSNPCCGNPDPCCPNTDPCDPECGDPCAPGCIDCDDGNVCTDDACDPILLACVHTPVCPPTITCCGGDCCDPGEVCCGDACGPLVEMDAVTSGVSPVPVNPAIVAPMAPLWMADSTLWWEANTFALTTVEPPDTDLTTLPATWAFVVTSGFMTPLANVVVAEDRRSARLEIPFPSSSNLGEGRMEFRLDNHPCASVTTLIKNIQPDLEPGDFRFQVKAHLCTDGAGTSTTRTPAEIQTIMSDVTKVLSQSGIYISVSGIVVETVPMALVDDLSIYLGVVDHELFDLFDYSEDESDIDVYFVQQIDGDLTAGVTVSPTRSLSWEAGVAIADHSEDGNLQGQELVRVLAHELTHYLLNHFIGNDDHRPSTKNLMYAPALDTSRDLDESQCIEIRTNFGVD